MRLGLAPAVVLALFLFLLLLQTDLLPLFFPAIVFGGHFFWLPQIVRNASRGVRGALRWRYILGTTAARLWYVAYFGSGWVRDNVLFLEHSRASFPFLSPRPFPPSRVARHTDRRRGACVSRGAAGWFTAIVVGQIAQLALLALQDVVSPTFFLPARFAPPPPYDYHPALPAHAASARAAADGSGGGAGEKDVERDAAGASWDRGDCAICMEPLLSPSTTTKSADDDGGGSLGAALGGVGGSVVAGLRGRELALAPCHHVFVSLFKALPPPSPFSPPHPPYHSPSFA